MALYGMNGYIQISMPFGMYLCQRIWWLLGTPTSQNILYLFRYVGGSGGYLFYK